MIVKGYGKHFEASGPNVLHDFLLNFFVAFIWFTVIIAFVKYSILALYWRVFGRGNVRWPVWTLTAVVTAWGIAVVRKDTKLVSETSSVDRYLAVCHNLCLCST